MLHALSILLACSQVEPISRSEGEDPQAEEGADEEEEMLQELGYFDGVADDQIATSGVVVNVAGKVSPGLNFYSSRKQSSAQLIDMEGKVVHRWSVPRTGAWQHVTLLPNGDVLALVKDKHLLRVDKDSNVLWRFKARVHHDLDVAADGTIYVLARRDVKRPRYATQTPTIEDYIQVLSPEGKPIRQISVLGLLERSPYAFLIDDRDSLAAITHANARVPDAPFDVLHVNHIEVLDGSLGPKNRAFREGNLLLCSRQAETPFVYDPEGDKVEWLWGTSGLIWPHDPTVTSDGTVLIFNNGTEATGSQIVEVDPSTNDIVWTYGPVPGFYSEFRGSNQRLPNGNTLITESDSGYVFEVNRAGEVVWEFRNPHRKHGPDKVRMAIWRMTRFAPGTLPFLEP